MKKPAQSIASPEALNKRLQKTSPATWAVLFGVIAILIGFFAWSFVAKIPVKLTGSASLVANKASLHIKEKDLAKVEVGQKVYILEQVGEVISKNGDTIIASPFNLADGEQYTYTLVVRELHPINFLIGG